MSVYTYSLASPQIAPERFYLIRFIQDDFRLVSIKRIAKTKAWGVLRRFLRKPPGSSRRATETRVTFSDSVLFRRTIMRQAKLRVWAEQSLGLPRTERLRLLGLLVLDRYGEITPDERQDLTRLMGAVAFGIVERRRQTRERRDSRNGDNLD